MHLGVLLAAVGAVLTWLLMTRTTLGFAIRAVGEKPAPPPMAASRSAGWCC